MLMVCVCMYVCLHRANTVLCPDAYRIVLLCAQPNNNDTSRTSGSNTTYYFHSARGKHACKGFCPRTLSLTFTIVHLLIDIAKRFVYHRYVWTREQVETMNRVQWLDMDNVQTPTRSRTGPSDQSKSKYTPK